MSGPAAFSRSTRRVMEYATYTDPITISGHTEEEKKTKTLLKNRKRKRSISSGGKRGALEKGTATGETTLEESDGGLQSSPSLHIASVIQKGQGGGMENQAGAAVGGKVKHIVCPSLEERRRGLLLGLTATPSAMKVTTKKSQPKNRSATSLPEHAISIVLVCHVNDVITSTTPLPTDTNADDETQLETEIHVLCDEFVKRSTEQREEGGKKICYQRVPTLLRHQKEGGITTPRRAKKTSEEPVLLINTPEGSTTEEGEGEKEKGTSIIIFLTPSSIPTFLGVGDQEWPRRLKNLFIVSGVEDIMSQRSEEQPGTGDTRIPCQLIFHVLQNPPKTSPSSHSPSSLNKTENKTSSLFEGKKQRQSCIQSLINAITPLHPTSSRMLTTPSAPKKSVQLVAFQCQQNIILSPPMSSTATTATGSDKKKKDGQWEADSLVAIDSLHQFPQHHFVLTIASGRQRLQSLLSLLLSSTKSPLSPSTSFPSSKTEKAQGGRGNDGKSKVSLLWVIFPSVEEVKHMYDLLMALQSSLSNSLSNDTDLHPSYTPLSAFQRVQIHGDYTNSDGNNNSKPAEVIKGEEGERNTSSSSSIIMPTRVGSTMGGCCLPQLLQQGRSNKGGGLHDDHEMILLLSSVTPTEIQSCLQKVQQNKKDEEGEGDDTGAEVHVVMYGPFHPVAYLPAFATPSSAVVPKEMKRKEKLKNVAENQKNTSSVVKSIRWYLLPNSPQYRARKASARMTGTEQKEEQSQYCVNILRRSLMQLEKTLLGDDEEKERSESDFAAASLLRFFHLQDCPPPRVGSTNGSSLLLHKAEGIIAKNFMLATDVFNAYRAFMKKICFAKRGGEGSGAQSGNSSLTALLPPALTYALSTSTKVEEDVDINNARRLKSKHDQLTLWLQFCFYPQFTASEGQAGQQPPPLDLRTQETPYRPQQDYFKLASQRMHRETIETAMKMGIAE